MTQLRHLLAKDLRRLRWSIAVWCVLVAARALIDTAGADVALGGFGLQFAISQLSWLLSLVSVLLLALLLSRLVHEDPLVGGDTFWITRPIAPGALMTAKLVFAALFFIVVPMVGGVIAASAFRTSGRDLVRILPVLALDQSILVALLMAIAAMTPSLVRYALAIVGLIVALVGMMAVMLFAAVMTQGIQEGGHAGPPDHTQAVVFGLLIVCTALAVIVYQYRKRRPARALAIAGAGLVLAIVVADRWPWSFAVFPRSETAAPPPDSPAFTVSLDGSRPRVTQTQELLSRRAARRDVSAPATVEGMPREFVLGAITARSRFELPGGAVLESDADRWRGTALYSGSAGAPGPSIEAALGGARLLAGSGLPYDRALVGEWPVLLRVDERDFAGHRAERGRLSATLDVTFRRPIVRVTLPLAFGAAAHVDARHVTIVGVIRRAAGCTILLRHAYVEPLLSVLPYRNFVYVLRNRTRNEAAASEVRPIFDAFAATNSTFFVGGLHVGGHGFVLEQYELVFPAIGRPDEPQADLDDAWLAGAELVILEIIPAGRITRTVTLDGFRMSP
jgi:hypothetical protein